MPRLEATLLDRFVNGAFAGKRKIGRPLKYNIRHKGHQGWIELCFNPRTRFEQYISEAMRFIHPYLFFITYRFHVEKAREAGKFLHRARDQPWFEMSISFGFVSNVQGLRLKSQGVCAFWPAKDKSFRI